MTDPAVALEQSRLESLVAVVFEERHYHHDCGCTLCVDTRMHMTTSDRAFVDTVSKLVRSSPYFGNGSS